MLFGRELSDIIDNSIDVFLGKNIMADWDMYIHDIDDPARPLPLIENLSNVEQLTEWRVDQTSLHEYKIGNYKNNAYLTFGDQIIGAYENDLRIDLRHQGKCLSVPLVAAKALLAERCIPNPNRKMTSAGRHSLTACYNCIRKIATR